MCGRYSITTPAEALQRAFKFEGPLPNLAARYNVAPTQDVPVVRLEDGVRRLRFVRWGLVPAWAREVGNPPLINARAETIAGKPSFREAFRHRHCLVPADSFYEWATYGPFEKQPYRFRRPDGRPFAFAGIWEAWDGPEGTVESMAIVSTAANALLAELHDRCPVILPEERWEAWLDAGRAGVEASQAMLVAPPEDYLEMYPVSKDVNRVANDGPRLWDPVEAEPKPEPPPKKPTKAAQRRAAQPDLF